MTRRDFFRIFVLGGLTGYLMKTFRLGTAPKKAMFWRKAK